MNGGQSAPPFNLELPFGGSSGYRLSRQEARYLVALHTAMGRVGATAWASDTPLAKAFRRQVERMKGSIRSLLLTWVNETPQGQWMLQQGGVGPYLAGAVLSVFDIESARSPASWWAYAGLTMRGRENGYNDFAHFITSMLGAMMRRKDPYWSEVYRSKQALLWEANLRGELQDRALEKVRELGGYGRSEQEHAWLTGKVSLAYLRDVWEHEGRMPYSVPPGKGHPMLTPPHILGLARRYYLRHILTNIYEVAYYGTHGERYEVPQWVTERVPGYAPPPSPPWGDADTGAYPGNEQNSPQE